MSFRSLRERRFLSQERLAELSGLSLRTIQRVEAGHRVSYASLRALAATLEMDVDLLERELYAMKQSTVDFVEIPRWVRLLTDGRWMGAPPISRRQAHVHEAICMGLGIVFLAASFLVNPRFVVTVLRVSGSFALVSGYLVSVGIRITDTYKLWPATEIAMSEWRPVRTLRSTIGFYTYVSLVLILFWGLVFWLAG
jgi:transcriptional regulator with XRE-family HTH domain